GLFGSGRICGCHDHLQENAPNDGPTQDGETRELVVRPYTAIVGYAASSHRRGKLEKRFCATICNTQASRVVLTLNQPAIPRQGGYLRTEDAAGRQQKGFPIISSQLSYRCFRCVDRCASYCSSRKRHGDPRCAGSTRLLWLLRSATNRLPLS